MQKLYAFFILDIIDFYFRYFLFCDSQNFKYYKKTFKKNAMRLQPLAT